MKFKSVIWWRISALLFVVAMAGCGGQQTKSFVPNSGDLSPQSTVFHLTDPVTITEFPLPSSAGAISGEGVVADGTLWAPASPPYAVKVLSNGTASAVSLALMPGDCTVTSLQCELPIAATSHDNSIWFLVSYMTGTISNSLLEQVNPTTGAVENYIDQPVSTAFPATGPGSSVVGADGGKLWYPECAVPTPCYVIANTSSNAVAYNTGSHTGIVIASGPDGKLYMTETFGSSGADVARIAINGAVLERYPLPAGSQPNGIASGCDHNLWVVETATNEIARLSLTGVVTQFHIPTPGSQPTSIALGADSNMWFTEKAGNKIGRITPSGAITEYTDPIAGSEPSAIMGPYVGNCPHLAHGTLWIGQSNVAKVGKLTF